MSAKSCFWRGERIGFTTFLSPFGWLVLGVSERGLCWLALAETEVEAEATLRHEFAAATIIGDPSLMSLAESILAGITGEILVSETLAPPQVELAPPQVLDLRGTEFQLQVWQALQQIPRGKTVSYRQLASESGHPKAVRAVASACAANRVALAVPCHRVIGADGSLAGYRWGIERKRQLLEAEMSARDAVFQFTAESISTAVENPS